MNNKFNQRIECSVRDCFYNNDSGNCTLAKISVGKDYKNTDTKDNTMCRNYMKVTNRQ